MKNACRSIVILVHGFASMPALADCGDPHVIYRSDYFLDTCPFIIPTLVGDSVEYRDRSAIDGDAGNVCLALTYPSGPLPAGAYVQIADQWLPNTLYEVEFTAAIGDGSSSDDFEVYAGLVPMGADEISQLADFGDIFASFFPTPPRLDRGDATTPGTPILTIRNTFFSADHLGVSWRRLTCGSAPDGPVSLVFIALGSGSTDVYIDDVVVRAIPIAEADLPTGRDFNARFGPPQWVQTDGTTVFDNTEASSQYAFGSEIDAIYTKVVGDSLHVALAGNLDTFRQTPVNLFVDYGTSTYGSQNWYAGQSRIQANNAADVSPDDPLRRLGESFGGSAEGWGVVFDAGFNPDLFLSLTGRPSGVGDVEYELGVADFQSSLDDGHAETWGGSLDDCGMVWARHNRWFDEHSRYRFENSGGSFDIFAVVDNSNTGGVAQAGQPAVSDPALVDTGIEFRIDGLSGSGWDGVRPIRVGAFLSNKPRSVVSNQVVGGSGNPTTPLGEPRTLNFRQINGKQYVIAAGDPEFYDLIERPNLLIGGSIGGSIDRPGHDAGNSVAPFESLIDTPNGNIYVIGDLRDSYDEAPGVTCNSLTITGDGSVIIREQLTVHTDLLILDDDDDDYPGTLRLGSSNACTLNLEDMPPDWPESFDVDIELPTGCAFPTVDVGGVLRNDGELYTYQPGARVNALRFEGNGLIEMDPSPGLGSHVIFSFWDEFDFQGPIYGGVRDSHFGGNDLYVSMLRPLDGRPSSLVLAPYSDSYNTVDETSPDPSRTTWPGIRIEPGVTWSLQGVQSFDGDLHIRPGGTLRHPLEAGVGSADLGLEINLGGELVIDEGGAIDVSGRGWRAGSGSGIGDSVGSSTCNYGAFGGSGHGGKGGTGVANTPGNTAAGGTGIANVVDPMTFGTGASCARPGGQGGGLVRLIVQGDALINGEIRADGRGYGFSGACSVYDVGGAAGGGVLLSASTVSGAGMIRANGGPADGGFHASAGGGGGGIVAIYSPMINVDLEAQIQVSGGSQGVAFGGLCGPVSADGEPGDPGSVLCFGELYGSSGLCRVDLNQDGLIDLADVLMFAIAFSGNDPIADFDENGLFDLEDVIAFVSEFTAGCP